MLKITKTNSPEEIEIVRSLFLEYATSLNFSLCFQNFSEELKNLPGDYASPGGSLLLAYWNNSPAGCAALRKLDEGICEIKRLYVKKEFRGKNIGRLLVDEIIKETKKIGYNIMRLDTVPIMATARKLYEDIGFYRIEPYRENPIDGAIYMEIKLDEI